MLPEEFLNNMKQLLGEEYPQFLQSFSQEKYQALRVNTLKNSVEDFLQKKQFQLTGVCWEETGFYYNADEQPGKHPYHEAGVYYIQEPSAMISAVLLRAEPGEKVLDLCAEPGGKTTQLAAQMSGQGILISNEIHPQRARILSENVERMGIRNCVVTNEAPAKLAQCFPGVFDKIMVDAPCSGEGMFRKNEEACQEWSLDNVRKCADRQDEILDCAAKMLRAGGKIVYSTCTFETLENEETIERFLTGHRDFTCMKQERIWPHREKGEGHFAALLQKEGQAEGEFPTTIQPLGKKECPEYWNFLEETLTKIPQGILIRFGDQIYLAPENCPDLKGLKVLRPGLHMGTLKKNRFEPSHALALTLSAGQVFHAIRLQLKDRRVMEYFNGQTVPVTFSDCAKTLNVNPDENIDKNPNQILEKGWYLILVDDYSIGWGKYAGGIMKNHYPKGLRSKSARKGD